MKKLGILSLISAVALSVSAYAGPVKTYERDASEYNGVVAAATPEASQVGVDILKKGGNAVDAAVATAFAIGVLEPNASGLGGGGFMLIKPAKGKATIIDFREDAPNKATSNMYPVDANGKPTDDTKKVGGKAVGTPGEVSGLLIALKEHGTMTRREVMQPAIDYAKNGITVTANFADMIGNNYDKISKFESTSKIYLNDGLPFFEGEILKNPDLAATLEKVADNGAVAFYRGDVAKKIVDAVQSTGGILTEDDMKEYFVQKVEPVEGTYRGHKIMSMPSPSSGGAHIIQMLNMMENYDIRSMGDNTADTWHLWSEVMRQMFADRSTHMGDVNFVDVPTKGIVSKDYAKELTTKLNMDNPTEDMKPGNPWKYESESTTHISVMDKEGNMVAITKTINHFFGSGVVAEGTGILLNNTMDDFDAAEGLKNSVAPNKKPLSSMSPTVVLAEDGKPLMTVGSPGATRIITAVAQVISNVIDHGMDIQEAINAPRITQFQFGPLKAEGRMSINAYNKLLEKGHKIEVKKDYDLYFGGVQAVMMNYDKGILEGGADPRRDGEARGY